MATVSLPTYPSRRRAWCFLAVLFVASIVSVIDRAILNIVVDPVKLDLHLSDVHIALLQGLAFGLFYSAVGLLLGLTADRYSRRSLVLGGMALWSCATVGAGMAHSFGALFLSRVLVGLGEASLGPAAISLIGDLFPATGRGRPISIFLMGQALAVGLSISVAGTILAAAHAGRFDRVAMLHALAPWRLVFIFCGSAGVVVLVLLAGMQEPARHGAAVPHSLRVQATDCIAFMKRNGSIFLPLYLGFACVFAAAYGAGAWMPTMLMRQFGVDNSQLARWLGPLSLLLGIASPLLGGMIADHLARTRRHSARLLSVSFAALLGIPPALAAFAPGVRSAIVLVALVSAVTVLIGTLTFSALQAMVPGSMRGVAVALTGLVNTLIGATLGPLLVAEFTLRVYHDPRLIGYAIATVAVPALVTGAACFAWSSRALRAQLAADGEVIQLLEATPVPAESS